MKSYLSIDLVMRKKQIYKNLLIVVNCRQGHSGIRNPDKKIIKVNRVLVVPSADVRQKARHRKIHRTGC